MARMQAPAKLAKFLHYILGRRPAEFGLVPDGSGYVKIKELLKALHEEDGWRHVRRPHLDEIVMVLPRPGIQLKEDGIRAADRSRLQAPRPARDLPKLLFVGIRRRAQAHVLERGLIPAGGRLVLSSDRDLALRMGRRMDQQPVILTVNVQQALDRGIRFSQFGDSLFITEALPSDCLSGPPLPKARPQPKRSEAAETPAPERKPGSFVLDWGADEEKPAALRRRGRKKDPAWKKDLKHMKKRKKKFDKI